MIKHNIQTVGIIGAGTMGQGIAQVCAVAGFEVSVYDLDYLLAEKAKAIIEKNLQLLVAKNKLDAYESDAALSRITLEKSLPKADLIIEAAVEKLEVKQRIFEDLEKNNSIESILTSNTSSISITQIGSVLKTPGRFAGLHFFNPAPVMRLIEVIRSSATSDQTVERLLSFVQRIGKTGVVAQDSPGFIVNRVARHYYVESLKLLEEGGVTIEAIDKLMRSSGFKMGPFELMDLIGIDVNFAVTSSLFKSFHYDPKFRPSRIQQQKVDAGHLGKKSSRGFYDYVNGEKQTD